jgi:hypothetical protein
MKKAIFIVLLCSATFSLYNCGTNNDANSHTHKDGSTHADHDTTKPVQEEFITADTLKIDSSKKDTSVHTHENGEKHTH